jgi:phage FluMu protein Com
MAITAPPLPADHQVLCSVCGQTLAVSNFGALQLQKKHPRCRACAPNKFSNQQTAGHQSKRESKRARELRTLEAAGLITELVGQVPFELLPKQTAPDGRVLERACTYLADYVYRDDQGVLHVEDAKGMRTDVYRLKRKLMLYIHKIQVEEV